MEKLVISGVPLSNLEKKVLGMGLTFVPGPPTEKTREKHRNTEQTTQTNG